MFVFSCKSKKMDDNSEKSPVIDLATTIKMKVVKIDSLDNYYVIHTIDTNKHRYKLVSEKFYTNACVKIKQGLSYDLKVRDLFSNMILNKKEEFPTPVNYLDLKRCIDLKNNTKVCTEPGIVNIYRCYNLIGLCFVSE